MENQETPTEQQVIAPPLPVKFDNINKAMLEAQRRIKNAGKDRENTHFGNVYATLESVLDAVKDIANECGILIIQSPEEDEKGSFALVTKLVHDSGEVIQTRMTLLMDKRSMQALGSAITYARRYTLAALFCIGQEDDDANGTNGPKPGPAPRAPNQGNQPKPRPTPTPNPTAGQNVPAPRTQAQTIQPKQSAPPPYMYWKGAVGDFLVPVGQNKGTPIKALPIEYHTNVVDFIRSEYKKANKPIPPNCLDYMINVQKFNDQVNSPEPPVQEEPELDVPDFGVTPSAAKGPQFP